MELRVKVFEAFHKLVEAQDPHDLQYLPLKTPRRNSVNRIQLHGFQIKIYLNMTTS